MIKKLIAWLTKADRPPTPPLFEAGNTPPPPPPPRYSRVAHGTGDHAAEVPAPRRRLRLIKGEGEDAARQQHPSALEAEASEDNSPGVSDEAQEGSTPAEAGSEPIVRLVFSDGTSERIAAAGPGGVRVRYLAENLLPPKD